MAVEQYLHCNIDLVLCSLPMLWLLHGGRVDILELMLKDVITVCTINMGTKGVDLQGDAEHRGGV